MSNSLRNIFVVVAATLLLIAVHPAYSQIRQYKYPEPNSGLGKIAGKIMGGLQPVGCVKVCLMQNGEVIDSKVTDESGDYLFNYVTPGCYTIKANKEGYRTHILEHVTVWAERFTPVFFYLPKFNNTHMPSYPIVETYQYPKRWVKDLMRDDYDLYVNQPLPKVNSDDDD